MHYEVNMTRFDKIMSCIIIICGILMIYFFATKMIEFYEDKPYVENFVSDIGALK